MQAPSIRTLHLVTSLVVTLAVAALGQPPAWAQTRPTSRPATRPTTMPARFTAADYAAATASLLRFSKITQTSQTVLTPKITRMVMIESSGRYAFSPDGSRVGITFIRNDSAAAFTVLDVASCPAVLSANNPSLAIAPWSRGESVEQYRDSFSGLVFSPDSRHFAQAFAPVTGLGLTVLLDGRPVTERRYQSVNRLTFSPDSTKLAFCAVGSDNFPIIVLDGKEGKPNLMLLSALLFSPDSKRLAYVAVVNWTAGRQAVIVDGKAGKAYTNVSDTVWSKDSQKLAYVARTSDYQHAPQFCVVHGDQEGKPYRVILPGSVCFSPDSKQLIYVAANSTQGPFFIVSDKGEGPSHSYIIPESVAFDSAGRLRYTTTARCLYSEMMRLATTQPFSQYSGVKRHIDHQEANEGSYDYNTRACSADGKAEAYIDTVPGDPLPPDALRRGPEHLPRSRVVKNGTAGPAHMGQLSDVQVSPSGKHVAYLLRSWADTRSYEWSLFIDDAVIANLPGSPLELRFTNDDQLQFILSTRVPNGYMLMFVETSIHSPRGQ